MRNATALLLTVGRLDRATVGGLLVRRGGEHDPRPDDDVDPVAVLSFLDSLEQRFVQATEAGGAARFQLAEPLADVDLGTALVERQLDRRAPGAMDRLDDVDVALAPLLAGREANDLQIVDEQAHRVLDTQVVGDLARDRQHREGDAMTLDQPFALGAEKLGDDEMAGADGRLVEANGDAAAALGELDTGAQLLAAAHHADRRLRRLRIDRRAEGELDDRAGGDDFVGGDAGFKSRSAHPSLRICGVLPLGMSDAESLPAPGHRQPRGRRLRSRR
ncbi:MAG TPA: hypothetical protein VF319_13225 [Caldimonas sp.]